MHRAPWAWNARSVGQLVQGIRQGPRLVLEGMALAQPVAVLQKEDGLISVGGHRELPAGCTCQHELQQRIGPLELRTPGQGLVDRFNEVLAGPADEVDLEALDNVREDVGQRDLQRAQRQT